MTRGERPDPRSPDGAPSEPEGEEQARTERLLALLPFPVAHLDRDCRLVLVNEAYAQAHGRRPAEILRRSYFDFHPEEPDREAMRGVFDSGQPCHEVAIPFAPPGGIEGATRYWNRFLLPVKDDAGEVGGILLCLQDVTASRHADARHEVLAGRLRAVVEIADRLVACPDADTALRTAVELSRERLGLERAAIFIAEGDRMHGTYGTDHEGRTTDEHHASFPAEDLDALFESSPDDGEEPGWVIRHAAHSYWRDDARVVHGAGWVAYTPIRSEGRAPIGLFSNDAALSGAPPDCDLQRTVAVLAAILHTVLERKRAEADRLQLEMDLQHAQRLESLSVLAGGVAHDFNNLLTGVLGNAELALEILPPEHEVAPMLRGLIDSAGRGAALARQMLAYSGAASVLTEPVDLTRLVQGTSRLLEAAVGNRTAIHLELTSGLPLTQGDPTQLTQVLMNLVINASEAIGDDPGAVTLRTGEMGADAAYLARCYRMGHDLPAGRYVYLQVADSGCGMDAATRERVFDPFFSTKFQGRGLGLAAALGIVRGHRGGILVESAPGRGSVFTVLLPPAEAGAAAAPSPCDEAPGRAGALVLLAEDEPSVRLIAFRALEQAGYTVVAAEDGEQAVKAFLGRRDEFAAAVLDLTMPRRTGDQVVEIIAPLRPDMPVLLCSGFSREDATRRLAGRRLAGFLQKPYRPSELVAELHAALGGGAQTSNGRDG